MAIFVGCEIILLLTGVGLWALTHDTLSAIVSVAVPAALAVLISRKFASS